MKFSKNGFTLVELLIAIFIITIGIMGIYLAIPRILSSASLNATQFLASYLAQEGFEIVRNIRDTNWLQGKNWKEGLGNGDYIVQYNDSSLHSFEDMVLKIDTNGFYNYESGMESRFKRKITISSEGSDKLNITVEITWPGKGGKTESFIAKNNLYDWK